MKQKILRFNQDEAGDWVAELSCGHARHVRHRPPWQNYRWIMNAGGRASMIGEKLKCGLCTQGIDKPPTAKDSD